MTTLVCWLGVDARGPSSIYLASDSRISWTSGDAADPFNRTIETWDEGRKVFSCRSHPDLFGYVGDVVFPALVLSQVTALIDEGAILLDRPTGRERFAILATLLKQSAERVAANRRKPFSIVYATRDGVGMRANFGVFQLEWTDGQRWEEHMLKVPSSSDTVAILGSGAAQVSCWKERWDRTSEGATSRAIYASFCDAIQSAKDPWTGGGPQVVGLYRIGPGRTLGSFLGGEPFLLGVPMKGVTNLNPLLEWRNASFERCDASGKRLSAAQEHRVPRGLGNGGVKARRGGK